MANYNWFWRGIKSEISLCCIIFFESSWSTIRAQNKEYKDSMAYWTGNEGVVLCPCCVMDRLGFLSPDDDCRINFKHEAVV